VVRPTPIEALIGAIIWRHEGRGNPVSIVEILRLVDAQRYTGLNDRKVKEIVRQLRMMHRVPIGSLRGESHGYFRMVDAEDLEAGLRPLWSQVIEELRVLRAVAPRAWVAELRGQLAMEDERSGNEIRTDNSEAA
jgi:hypothetical protein